jgi:hypothetical protein
MGTHRNGAGHAYLSYFFSQRIILEGERYQQFDGAGIDVFGGLTLMFDATGRLRSVCFRPVSAEDVRQIKIMVADLINLGLIADSLPVTGDLTAPQPQALHLPGFPGKLRRDEARLVKFPALFDAVPEPPDDLGDYLQAWMEKEQ